MSHSTKHARDNRANQLNPLHPAFERSRGLSEADALRVTQERRGAASQESAHHTPTSTGVDSSSNASSAKPE